MTKERYYAMRPPTRVKVTRRGRTRYVYYAVEFQRCNKKDNTGTYVTSKRVCIGKFVGRSTMYIECNQRFPELFPNALMFTAEEYIARSKGFAKAYEQMQAYQEQKQQARAVAREKRRLAKAKAKAKAQEQALKKPQARRGRKPAVLKKLEQSMLEAAVA
ncbi:hypothetical protein [Psittacicella hinzii]|uniref:Uncharacterized protein n=1 Tax=Psittacicella hinzii TaxID=2028575 RepID=A0A3A1YT29_9GAMM|nr:hypothetical protein [Psittacicella hinzii]RIY40646.1 hypothetical protein CKF58_00275 [Psittacicella hinzii]